MAGSVILLKTKGQQDTYLTSNPEINFFVREYKKNVDFAIEQTRLYFYENVDFGKKITIQVPKRAEFLSNIHFCFTLDKLTKIDGSYVAWANSVGHVIIDYIDLEIGNKLIDRQYGLFMEIWEELTGKDKDENQMIGKTSTMSALTINASVPSSYQVPLQFFFCKGLWNALPLINMKYHDIKLIIKLRTFDECVIYDGTTAPSQVQILDSYFLADYIYIDETEKIRLKSSPRTMLMNQVQMVDVVVNGGVFKIDVPFNHPVKELLWVFVEDDSVLNNDWFNFSKRNIVPFTKVYSIMKNCKFLVEGKEYSEPKDEYVYRYVNTDRYHTNRTDRFIYCLSFADKPENWEPTGSLNFSKIDTAVLSGDIQTPVGPSKMHVFGVNHNWLLFENGLTSLRFIT